MNDLLDSYKRIALTGNQQLDSISKGHIFGIGRRFLREEIEIRMVCVVNFIQNQRERHEVITFLLSDKDFENYLKNNSIMSIREPFQLPTATEPLNSI